GHETDSGLGFSYFNDPSKVHDARSFQQAASLIGYTFNWFYVDSRKIAYFNSGFNPRRTAGTDPNFPVWGQYGWHGMEPARTHPQAIDPRFMTSWNNKQAPGTRAADGNWGYGPTYRSKTLTDRVLKAIRG